MLILNVEDYDIKMCCVGMLMLVLCVCCVEVNFSTLVGVESSSAGTFFE